MHNPHHRPSQNRAFRFAPLVALLAAIFAPIVQAASFVIADGETVTTRLRVYANETGVIQTGGTLSTNTTALSASGLNATLINNGTISATGYGVAGITSTGANATVTNSGTVLATGMYAYGIYSRGDNATLLNSGTISATGDSSLGIFLNGTNATFTNRGTITATGDGAYGIESDINATNTTIINSGTITARGDQSRGISSNGDNDTITNTGSISTTGNSAMGIWLQGINATLTNSGAITTTGEQAHGIFSAAATLTNSGTISTTGNGAHAIYSAGTNTTLTNSGTISTTGINSHGIESTGTSATLTHSGDITVTGSSAIGIDVIGTGSNLIAVSGSIIAADSASEAIRGGGGNETLNLLPGAKIIGTIDLGTGANVVNVTANGAGPSVTMSINNAGTINTTVGNALAFVNNSSNTVHLVDTTNITASQASLGTLSSNIFQSVNQQLNRTPAMHRPTKVASNGSDAGLWADDTTPNGWGQVFGKYAKHDSSGAALAFRDQTYGVIGGYEQRLGDYRAGVFGGVAQSDVDTESSSASTNSNSAFVGVYGQYAKENWRFNGVLAVGYANYNGDRRVTDNLYGNEIALANFHGLYVSPSASITRIFEQGAGFSLRPSVELNYTYGRLGSYDESGTTRSNLSVGSRTTQVLNTRLQLAARQELADKKGEYELRGGWSHTRYGDDSITIAMQGVGTTRFSLTGTGNVSGAYIGVGGRIHWDKSLNFVGDIELFRPNDNNCSVMAYAGLEYRF